MNKEEERGRRNFQIKISFLEMDLFYKHLVGNIGKESY